MGLGGEGVRRLLSPDGADRSGRPLLRGLLRGDKARARAESLCTQELPRMRSVAPRAEDGGCFLDGGGERDRLLDVREESLVPEEF